MGRIIILAGSEVPMERLGEPLLKDRAFLCGTQPEFRFALGDPRPKTPILRSGEMQFPRWGNRDGRSLILPRVAYTRLETVRSGAWSKYGGIEIDIPANRYEHDGATLFIREGIRAILAPDERGMAVCFVICEPSSNYYRNMTSGGAWMPLFINQRY